MSASPQIIRTEVLWVRVYLPTREHYRNASWWRRWFGIMPTPYRDLVREAQRAEIECAVVQATTFGYTGFGQLQADDLTEIPNPYLYVAVDLIGEVGLVEAFCVDRANLLEGKVVVAQRLERWRF